jgi:hypothetical protein
MVDLCLPGPVGGLTRCPGLAVQTAAVLAEVKGMFRAFTWGGRNDRR